MESGNYSVYVLYALALLVALLQNRQIKRSNEQHNMVHLDEQNIINMNFLWVHICWAERTHARTPFTSHRKRGREAEEEAAVACTMYVALYCISMSSSGDGEGSGATLLPACRFYFS